MLAENPEGEQRGGQLLLQPLLPGVVAGEVLVEPERSRARRFDDPEEPEEERLGGAARLGGRGDQALAQQVE